MQLDLIAILTAIYTGYLCPPPIPIQLSTGLVIFCDKALYLLELTVGFETNILINSNRKAAKYNSLIKDIYTQFRTVHFINLSMGALGIL